MFKAKLRTNDDKPVENRILRRPEVEFRTGMSRSGIYAAMDRDVFPKPVRIGKRAVGWLKSDIDNWILNRMGAL